MIPVFIGAAFLGLVITAGLVIRGRRDDRRGSGVLMEVAPRIGAPQRLDSPSVLRFDRRGFPAALSILSRTRHNVEVSFRLSGEEAGWLTVSTLGLKRAFLEQFGFKDFQVGDAEFDERLEVWGADRFWTSRRLRPEIRALILQMDRRWNFYMRLTPDQLVIRAQVRPLERYSLESVAGIAFQILDLLDPASPTAVVVASVREVLDSETRCQVCGTPLSRGRLVRCAKCRAAHHADCWQFNGLCATFACGGREKKAG